jgi:hypothetical protein
VPSRASSFDGWRFNHVSDINALGDFAGVLVPVAQDSSSSSSQHVLVTGTLDLNDIPTDPLLIELDRFEDGTATGDFLAIGDMNELGEIVVSIRVNGNNQNVIYDGWGTKTLLEIPSGAIQAGSSPSLNNAGQVARSVQVSERKWNELISNIDPNVPELNLGVFGRSPQISESGALYDRPDGTGLGNDYELPRRWSQDSGQWDIFAPPSYVAHVSKALGQEEVILSPNAESPDPATPMVFRHGLGTYLIDVTGAETDVALWNDHAIPGERSASAISRPKSAGGYGYIAGSIHIDGVRKGFILTPLVPQE